MQRTLGSVSRLALIRTARSLQPGPLYGGARSGAAMNASSVYITRRFNSDLSDKGSVAPPAPVSGIDGSTLADGSVSDLAMKAADVAANTPPEVGMVVGHIMTAIDHIHIFADIPYWGAIVAFTLGVRALLLPVAIKTVQGSSRMAAMRPEMQLVQDRMSKDPRINETGVKLRYQQEMQALFVKYKVKPFRALLWPFFQFPVFIGVFMALREMGLHYPGFATGGALWFTDLAAADPTYVLPVLNSLSMLLMMEFSTDGVQVQQQQMFKNIMRGFAVLAVPLTMSMPSAMFLYWVTNNFLSLGQSLVLKNEGVRAYLDIPKPPAAENTPVLKMVNPLKSIQEALEKERAQKTNARAEILDGVAAPPAPPSSPPPVSFAMPPRQSRRPKAPTATAPPKA